MNVDVVVVGGGPAGLAAAIALRRDRDTRVVVVERESIAGGIPRHSAHSGFGMRDLHRVLTGPTYARRYAEMAERAGVEVWTDATATTWSGPRALAVTRPVGVESLQSEAIVLATGCRERPRSARLVPGSRPAGVLTTGALQQLVQRGLAVGTSAVVVGAEHVSVSAVLTLAHAGVRVVALVTEYPRPQTYFAYRVPTTFRHRVPIITSVGVASVEGRGRVEAIVLSDGRRIGCDTVVFTGDWMPDNELARRHPLSVAIDAPTRAPAVDGGLRTSVPGVFAAGNLLHGAETADVCALDGVHVAASVRAILNGAPWPAFGVPVDAKAPLLWVSPNRVRPDDAPPRGRFLLRASRFIDTDRLAVTQGDRTLWTGRARGRLVPNRPIAIPGSWTDLVDVEGPPVTIAVSDLR